MLLKYCTNSDAGDGDNDGYNQGDYNQQGNQGGGQNNQGGNNQPPTIGRPEDEYPTEPSEPADDDEDETPPQPHNLPPAHELFTDVSQDAWYHDFVTVVANHGLFHGIGDGRFNPQATMTRAMFAQVAANLQGVDISAFAGGTRFDDVAPDAWYNAAVEWAAYMGIVSGIGNNHFNPSAPITREEMAVILQRLVAVMEIYLPMLGYDEIAPFTDQDSVSAWALNSVTFIQAVGIISGRLDGSFGPQATATRAEVATIFARFLEVLESQDR